MSFKLAAVVIAGLFHDVRGTLNGRLLPDGEMVYGCTCNLGMSLKHVPTLFDASFPIASLEDLEWVMRAKKEGIQITYVPEAAVQHCFKPGFKGVFRQFQRYGAFQDLMSQKHPDFGRLIHEPSAITSHSYAPQTCRYAWRANGDQPLCLQLAQIAASSALRAW